MAISVLTATTLNWAKVKIYYKTSLASLTATSTATDYNVDNLLDFLENTSWKATSTATQYITYDAGVGNTYTADSLAISGHNLNTVGATLSLEYSTDNFVADVNDAFTAYEPASDFSLVKTFTSLAKRYWRLKVTGGSAAYEMAIAFWGAGVELDYASRSFDQNRQKNKASVNFSQTGYLLGIHNKWIERSFKIQFRDADDSLYTKIKDLWDDHGLNNFFLVWESDEHATEIFLMRMKSDFNSPFTRNAVYRNITLDLTGRVE